MPLALTPEQITTAKDECLKKFGHTRIVKIDIDYPIDVTVLMAAFGLSEAAEYVDARAKSRRSAAAGLIATRALLPSPKELQEIRDGRRLPAIDAQIEVAYRRVMGFVSRAPSVSRLTSLTAPPSMPADVLAQLVAKNPADNLWSAVNEENDFEVAFLAPVSETWAAATAADERASQSGRGRLTAILDYAKDHVLWSPKPIAEFIDEKPGRAEELKQAFLESGGAGAQASASFL